MTKIEEIYAAVLAEMEQNGIEDTPDNRLAMLRGLSDGWEEDPDESFEKSMYQLALTLEITILSMRMAYTNLDKGVS